MKNIKSNNDTNKTKEQLISEIEDLHNHIKELTDSNSNPQQIDQKYKKVIEKYNLLTNNISDVFFSVDSTFKIIDVSPSVEKLSGYKPNELIGMQFKDLKFLTPESIENTYQNVSQIMKGEQLPYTEYEFFTKKGEKKFMEVKSTPIFKNGKFIELIAIARDITERKKAEKGQKATEKKYTNLINNISDVIIEMNLDADFTYVSPQVVNIFGYQPEEIIGKSGFDFIHPEDKEITAEAMEKLLNENDEISIEYRVQHKNGHYIPVSTRGKLIKDEKNPRFIGILTDITKRKSAEQKMVDERNRAEFYLELLGHDINNLNQAIVSYNEILGSKPDMPEKYREYLNKSLNQAMAVSELISNVEKLSLLQKGEYEEKDLDIFPILEGSIEMVKRSFPDKQIHVNHNISEATIIVKSNELLQNAFNNLFSNAVKFNSNNKITVDISYSQTADGNYWRIELEDNGIGIPDIEKENIFKRFERGSENVHGKGLGLAIVREIMFCTGGKVWVEDRVKGDHTKGSNFIILIPKGEILNIA